METDLDTLATALFVKTDDLLKSSPQLAPWRPTVGITPQLMISQPDAVTAVIRKAHAAVRCRPVWRYSIPSARRDPTSRNCSHEGQAE